MSFHSASITRMRLRQAEAELGERHPKTRALLGRLRALTGWTPQRGMENSIEVIAWSRETGAAPGLWNRAHRGSTS